MQSSATPTKFGTAFAASGAKNAIPAPSQVGVTPGAASLTDGFPPLTRTPIASGGVPPSGLDMNGILYMLSLWAQWHAGGGPNVYDSAFSTAIGGYPLGARLSSATTPGVTWVNTAENNTSNPDTGGANWIRSVPGFSRMQTFTANGTFTVPQGCVALKVRLWAAGGGGGSGTTTGAAGSGAGGGGYAEGVYAVSPGDSINVVVGGGGTGSSGAFNGTAGGPSSFGSLCSATGGGGGFYSSGGGQASVGSAGLGTGGQINVYAQSGGTALVIGSTALGGPAGGAFSAPGVTYSVGAGGSGMTPGGGGGGGANASNGGSGGAGLVIVEF